MFNSNHKLQFRNEKISGNLEQEYVNYLKINK